MPDITISITDTEQKALEYAMADITDWTDNAVTNQARIVKDEIISLLISFNIDLNSSYASNL